MRTVRLVLGAVAVPLIVIGIGAYVLFMPVKQTADIPLPPDGAPPQKVIRSFIEAVNAHDCDTAAELAVDGFRDDARSWCRNAKSLESLEIGEVVPVRSKTEERVHVAVSFELTWRMFHKDASFPEGRMDWGFDLVATQRGGLWRIADQGTL